jgi:hypothetical protein
LWQVLDQLRVFRLLLSQHLFSSFLELVASQLAFSPQASWREFLRRTSSMSEPSYLHLPYQLSCPLSLAAWQAASQEG